MKIFCPKCGEPLAAETKICPNCGTDIINYQKEKKTSNKTRNNQLSKQKNQNYLPLWIIGILAVLLVLFGIFYTWGHSHYSKENQVREIKSALKNSKADLSKYVTSSIAVNNNNLKALRKYLNQHPNLKQINKNSHLRLVKSGSYWLLFPRYAVRVPSYRVKLQSTQQAVTYKIDGKASAASRKLLLGIYSFHASAKLNGKKQLVNSKREVDKDMTVNLPIQTRTFTVKALPGSAIYVNNKKVGTTNKKGQAIFANYPANQEIDLQVIAKMNGKKVKSVMIKDLMRQIAQVEQSKKRTQAVQIKQGRITVSPVFTGILTDKNAQDLLEKIFSKTKNTQFINGAKNKDYQALKKVLTNLKSDPNLKKMSSEIDVETIEPTNNTSSNVNFRVTYNFAYPKYTRIHTDEYQGCIIRLNGGSYKVLTIGQGKSVSDKEVK